MVKEMRIKKIRIENFKRFDDMELELSPLNCIVGANNSGKSTLLQSLALFDFVLHYSIAQKNGANSTLETKSRSIATEDFFVLPVSNPIDLWTKKLARKRNKPIPINITVGFDNNEQMSTSIVLTFNRFLVNTDISADNQELLRTLKEYKISYLPIFSSFLAQEERRTAAVLEDALARGRVNSVMRNLLYDLKEQGKLSELVDILQRAFIEIRKLNVQFDETVNRFIDVTYLEQGHGKSFDLFMSGSGFQQFVYLFGFILLKNPDVILLDEPDVHLHGVLQGALLDELNRLVDEKGKQIVFATHSRDLIDKVDPQNILSLHEGNAKRLQVRFDLYDTLKSLGSFDQLEMAKLQTFRRLLVLENESDWRLLQIFCTKILGEPTWHQIEQKISLWYNKGNPAKSDLRKLRDQHSETFGFTGEPLKIFAIGDLDYCPDREKFMKKKSDTNVTLHLWERNEIENYLLNENVITRLVTEDRELFRDTILSNVRQQFALFVEEHKDEVEIQCTQAIKHYERQVNESKKDETEFHRAAKKFMSEYWEKNKVALTDAKKVLAKMKEWFQDNAQGQFSNVKLAESFERQEISEDIIEVAKLLCDFVGVVLSK